MYVYVCVYTCVCTRECDSACLQGQVSCAPCLTSLRQGLSLELELELLGCLINELWQATHLHSSQHQAYSMYSTVMPFFLHGGWGFELVSSCLPTETSPQPSKCILIPVCTIHTPHVTQPHVTSSSSLLDREGLE